jgi:hypothetical protein
LFGKRRDENHWYAATLRDQAILKIKAAPTLHLCVGDQTRAVVDPRRAQEILSAFERESATKPSGLIRLSNATRTDAS